MLVNSSHYISVHDSSFEDNTLHGVELAGTAYTEDTLFHHCNFHGNGGYGLKITNSNVASTVIESECLFDGNTLGDILDNGVGTINQAAKADRDMAKIIWDEQTSAHVTPGTMGYAQSQTSGLSSQQATMLLEMYAILGLDPAKPLIVTDTSRTAGAGIQQTVNTTQNQTTVTRV